VFKALRPGEVPKAPNGKIQRSATRARYLAGGFRPFAAYERKVTPQPRSLRTPELERGLVDRVARELGLPADEVDRDEPLANEGLSSLSAATLAGESETWLGVVLSSSPSRFESWRAHL